MCLIEVQKYGITRRHESALAQKKKLATKHCEFFVLGYKTGTKESVITRQHNTHSSTRITFLPVLITMGYIFAYPPNLSLTIPAKFGNKTQPFSVMNFGQIRE